MKKQFSEIGKNCLLGRHKTGGFLIFAIGDIRAYWKDRIEVQA